MSRRMVRLGLVASPQRREQRTYSVAEAADQLGVSDMTLYRAIHRGEFPAIKVGGRMMIPKKVLDEMLESAEPDGGVVDPADWAEGSGDAERAATPGGLR